MQWGYWLEKCGFFFFLFFFLSRDYYSVWLWETELQISPPWSAGQAAEPWSPITYSVNDKAGMVLKGSHPHFYQRIFPKAEKLPISQPLGNLPFRDFCFQLMMVSHKTTEKHVFRSSVPEVTLGEDRQYKYICYGYISEKKKHHPISSQKLYFPQSLELEAAHPGVNNVVKNWCKVEFNEA